MSYNQQASRYRDVEVLSASPAQLVVLVYDHLLVSLRRARIAAESGNLEVRATQLARCREALGELLSTLDRERGGEVARNLASLYVFMLAELVDLGRHTDLARLDRVTAMVAELRDAFAQAAAGLPARAASH